MKGKRMINDFGIPTEFKTYRSNQKYFSNHIGICGPVIETKNDSGYDFNILCHNKITSLTTTDNIHILVNGDKYSSRTETKAARAVVESTKARIYNKMQQHRT